MARRNRGQPIHGWVCLDKPLELGSTQAVSRVKRLFDAQKAGHAGTLDPLATGVLPIALGEATKTVPFLMDAQKIYRFTIAWGTSTSTLDREGEVTGTSNVRPKPGDIRTALQGFVGEIEQVPPAYSAIKVAGQRAYDLARAGAEVELKARPVTIHAAELTNNTDPDHAEIVIRTGKGVYVRSLARDLATKLGAEGHVSKLRREQVGPFRTENGFGLELLEEMVHSNIASKALLPVATALDDIPDLAVNDEDAFRLRQGRSIVLLPRQIVSLKARMNVGSKAIAVVNGSEIVALCSLQVGGLKPDRVFNL